MRCSAPYATAKAWQCASGVEVQVLSTAMLVVVAMMIVQAAAEKERLTMNDDQMRFLMSALALALVCTVQGEEKQHSARWNRTRSAEESILRLCDTYKPGGLDSILLNKVWAVLDGPVTEVLRQYKDEIFAGVPDE